MGPRFSSSCLGSSQGRSRQIGIKNLEKALASLMLAISGAELGKVNPDPKTAPASHQDPRLRYNHKELLGAASGLLFLVALSDRQ